MASLDAPKEKWYHSLSKYSSINIEGLFSSKRPIGPPRTIYVNESLPEDWLDKKGRVQKDHVYPNNQIVTSKYTIITFLPRNLLEQFRRVANIFFLVINILQFFHQFSTISPGLVILPLAIILLVTAIKDGYEDLKRHQSDKAVNDTRVKVLAGGGFVNPNQMELKARTFVKGVQKINPARLRKTRQGAVQEGDTRPSATGTDSTLISRNEGSITRPSTDGNIEYDDDGSLTDSEDHLKHNADRPHWKQTRWEDIKVGDIIKVMNNQSIPADLLICATSEEENVAFIETKNLDGETNLKSRSAVPALTHLRTAAAWTDKSQKLKIDIGKANENMYSLEAALKINGQVHPVDLHETLLRGTTLRNTNWAIGIVLFTGSDTKIILNSGHTPSKRSRVERQMDPKVGWNLLLIVIMSLVCGVVDSVIEREKYPQGALWLYGDNQNGDNPQINGLITFIYGLITFQNIVPISLYISIEVVRTLQAAFIYFDKQIWYEKTDQATLAQTWNLSDDLGQIQYVFSDKTGTLTQNLMVFRECSINGKVYSGDEEEDAQSDVVEGQPKPVPEASSDKGSTSQDPELATADPVDAKGVKLAHGVVSHFKDKNLTADLEAAGSGNAARILNGFFTVLGLCHTVIAAVDPDTGAIEYKAQSPDEAALVQAAADAGFIFRGKDKEILLLQTPFSDELEKYELLNILDFTSARKRMSIVARKISGDEKRIFVLTKGADNVIFERLKAGGEQLKDETSKQLDEFANNGLRTLTLAYRMVGEEEYEAWAERYREATVAIDDREEAIGRVSEELERDLRLLGATAIEDKLQDGVPETIADLKRAGIKVWVATGDKLETAIAIGKSTNLVAPESNIIIVRGGGRSVLEQLASAAETYFPEAEILEKVHVNMQEFSKTDGSDPIPLRRVNTNVSSIVGADNGDRDGGFVLVIDGAALTVALEDERCRQLLLKVAIQCEGVICCRVSPRQKALIVKLVKHGLGVMCLAIGDGANDVSMIQAADVGVGIRGEEGLQAANSADYAIAQFRFLKRLLLVHGHWSYQRNGNMILNFFYKNIICVGVLWWFQIYCGWSAQYVLEYTYLLFWNSFWTIAPVIAIGLFDRVVDDHVLMAIPELYKPSREGKYFTNWSFTYYMLEGVYQSVAVFFLITYPYWTETARHDGYQVGLYEYSTVMVYAATFAANLFNGLNTKVWTWWVFFAIALGPVLLLLYSAVFSALSPQQIQSTVWGNNYYLWASAYFYLAQPLVVCVALLPRYLYLAIKVGYFPSDLDIMRLASKFHPNADFAKVAYRNGPLSTYLGASNTDLRGSTSRHASRINLDMSTGLRDVHRGFDFSTEESGVAIRRIQTNLSERRESQRNLPLDSKKRPSRFLSSLRRKP